MGDIDHILPKVIFLLPPDLGDINVASAQQVELLTNIQDLLTPGHHLQLRFQPEDYTKVTVGGDSDYYDYFESSNLPGVNIMPRRVGFNLRIRDSRHEIYILLRQLAKRSTSSGFDRYKMITVQDYALIEDLASYQAGYTTREGKIMSFDEIGGVFAKGTTNCDGSELRSSSKAMIGNGFGVRFMSAKQTEIF